MDRHAFIGTVAGGLLVAPLAAGAQQPAKVFRIGILGTYPPTTPEFAHLWNAFAQGLRELRYIEGQNLVVERRFMEEKAEQLPELAAELVRLNVSVIVAGGQPPPVAATRATATIPIVITNFSDPVGVGLVTSLSRRAGTRAPGPVNHGEWRGQGCCGEHAGATRRSGKRDGTSREGPSRELHFKILVRSQSGDQLHLPRLLRLGNDRRGEEATGQSVDERTSVHEEPPPDRPVKRARANARLSGLTLHLP